MRFGPRSRVVVKTGALASSVTKLGWENAL